jgi:Tripartite tricarboxylate transporter family receptor
MSALPLPDGYTLLIYHVGLAAAATLYRKLPYDTKSAFTAIGLVTEAPMTIIGRPDLPPDSLKDLVAYLKVAGAKTTLANAGIGSASHLCGMLLMSQLQVTLTTVPYRGTGPVMNDLLGKQVDMPRTSWGLLGGAAVALPYPGGRRTKGYSAEIGIRCFWATLKRNRPHCWLHELRLKHSCGTVLLLGRQRPAWHSQHDGGASRGTGLDQVGPCFHRASAP